MGSFSLDTTAMKKFVPKPPRVNNTPEEKWASRRARSAAMSEEKRKEAMKKGD
jgi:hypothetical protein